MDKSQAKKSYGKDQVCVVVFSVAAREAQKKTARGWSFSGFEPKWTPATSKCLKSGLR